ncbi:MAG: zinc ribbon domain-containing protein [Lachnospiraceae bacterium]|nr:zinc ribbon domain-containing protein [Lachnospiraceae bacterium]
MAKFCGKCGTKLDEATGLCPNCDADKLKNKKAISKKEAKKAKRTAGALRQRIGRIFFKFSLIVFLVSALAVGAAGALEYFDVIDIPIVAELLDIVGLKTMSNDSSEDINYENYKIEPLDADEYFQQHSQVMEEINVNDSNEVLTEAETVEILAERGFKDVPITTEYTMDGIYNDAYEISDASSVKHPIYETYYVSENDELWTIMVINGDVMAIPVSYNLQSTLGVQVIISESTSVTSYDSSTNKFYKNVPNESVMIVKVVEKIDAETLENLTIEVIDTL